MDLGLYQTFRLEFKLLSSLYTSLELIPETEISYSLKNENPKNSETDVTHYQQHFEAPEYEYREVDRITEEKKALQLFHRAQSKKLMTAGKRFFLAFF